MTFLNKYNAPKYLKRIEVGLMLYICLLFPLSCYMPREWGYENNLMEMLQNFVLLASVLLCLYFGIKNKKEDEGGYRELWFWASGVFLMLLGRELSWGRVFFPVDYGAEGPVFISIKALYPGIPVHETIAVCGVILFYFMFKVVPFRKILLEVPIPMGMLSLAFVLSFISWIADRGLITKIENFQLVEEMCEVGIYTALMSLAYYYYDSLGCGGGEE